MENIATPHIGFYANGSQIFCGLKVIQPVPQECLCFNPNHARMSLNHQIPKLTLFAPTLYKAKRLGL